MINMVNKYKNELDILGAMETNDSSYYYIEAEHDNFEVFHIDILEQLRDVLEGYLEDDPDDNIIQMDYHIVQDYLDLYEAYNSYK